MDNLPYFFTQAGLSELPLIRVATIAQAFDIVTSNAQPINCEEWLQRLGHLNEMYMPDTPEKRGQHALLVLEMADLNASHWEVLTMGIVHTARQMKNKQIDISFHIKDQLACIRTAPTIDDAFAIACSVASRVLNLDDDEEKYCLALLLLSVAVNPSLEEKFIAHYSRNRSRIPRDEHLPDGYLMLAMDGFYKMHRTHGTTYVSFDEMTLSGGVPREVCPRFLEKWGQGYLLIDLRGQVFNMNEDFTISPRFKIDGVTKIQGSNLVDNILIVQSDGHKLYYDIVTGFPTEEDPIEEANAIESDEDTVDVVHISPTNDVDCIQANHWIRKRKGQTHSYKLPETGQILDWCPLQHVQ